MAAIPKGEHEDIDNVDFANYKGIYAEEDSDQKYTCPVTGAHFEFNDVCRRLGKILVGRKRLEEQELIKLQQKQQVVKQQQKDVFSSSTLSVTDETGIKNNFHSSNLKAGQTNLAQDQLYARQQQQQQQQWLREQQAQQKQADNQKVLAAAAAASASASASAAVQKQQNESKSSTNLKHKKAQSNHIGGTSSGSGVQPVNQIQGGAGAGAGGSQTATKLKHKAQAESQQFHQLDQFVGSEGAPKYINKTSHARQTNPTAALPGQVQGPSDQHNMDSLEPDSVQQSTSKQLMRANNQQIQPQPNLGSQPQKALKNHYLQRNLTEVVGPNHQGVKKNNFFTEPDEAMIQQSVLLQHNQFYGLQQQNELQDQANLMQNSQAAHSVEGQQQQMTGNSQMFNVMINNNGVAAPQLQQQPDSNAVNQAQYHAQAHHYSTNPKQKESSKASSNKQHSSHHHQRTAASHFATQDNRQPSAFQMNHPSTNQLSAGGGATSQVPQPYTHTSKTVQGKTRKSTSLKTGAVGETTNDQMWQMTQQQKQSVQMGNQYQNMDQYNQLMAQLLKSQKSASVVGPVTASNLDKNNRTRTKSNATTSSMIGLAKGEAKLSGKQNLQKTSGSQFIGNQMQQQMSAQQLQSQTFSVNDSSQYYSNGLQGPHTKTQQSSKPLASGGSRNRDGSSVSIANRKNSSSQQKASLSNYIRQSQGTKTIKGSVASRNQPGIGGHLNSQVSKHGHRSVASSGQQFSTMQNYHQATKHQGHKSTNFAQGGAQQANPTHKIIDEVVLRLSQQQNQTSQAAATLQMQPQISGSRNQKNLIVSHTTGGPQAINKSSKHKSSGYFDQQAFNDIMTKYQRSNRPGANGTSTGGSGTNPAKYASNSHGIQAAKQQYVTQASAASGQQIGSGATHMSTGQKNQLSAKKQARLGQFVHKEQKSRNSNTHAIGNSKTVGESMHHQSIINQNQLGDEISAKETRAHKHSKVVSNQSRPMTSNNYVSHSAMGSKGSKTGNHGAANYASATASSQHQQEMYHHLSGHPQGLAVQGATKSKMTQGSTKSTIAISAVSKRKTPGMDQNISKAKSNRAAVQNQKVHLQQVQHPPQQSMNSQEITSEQMIMDYMNRMQQHQQMQQQQQQHTHHGALSMEIQQNPHIEQQQQVQQHPAPSSTVKKAGGSSSGTGKGNVRTRTGGSHAMMHSHH